MSSSKNRQPASSATLDWEAQEFPAALKQAARSVEFTSCALVNRGADTALNLFTAVVVRPRPHNPGWWQLTPKLLTIKGAFSLGIVQGEVTIEQGRSALGFVDVLELPECPGGGRVSAPGQWTPARFWGRGDTRPSWFPWLHDGLWSIERIPLGWELPGELNEKAAEVILTGLKEHVGVAIPRARWGEVLVAIPDARVWTSAEAHARGLGITILSRDPSAPKSFVVAARARRLDSTEYSRTYLLGEGHHALPYPDPIDAMDVEISDAESGYPVDRHSGPRLRETSYRMDMFVGEPSVLTADFVDPPRRVQLRFAERTTSVGGTRQAWEVMLKDEADRQRIEDLRQAGRVAFYLGKLGDAAEQDRADAMALLRGIIRRARTKVWIWDKYFGAHELLDFLTAVVDRDMDVRVMSSTKLPLDERLKLARAISWLRRPPAVPGGGLRSLDIRFGPSETTHDRFIITDDRCLILGCSLNHIGNVCSSALDFPDREALELGFLRAWSVAPSIETEA